MGSHVGAMKAAEEGPDDHADGGLIVEHFRVDVSGKLLRALGLGSLVMAIGSFVVAGALLVPRHGTERPVYARAAPSAAMFRAGAVTADGAPIRRGTERQELVLGLFGLLTIVGGGGLAILGLHRVMREEHFLALRTDGAFYRAGHERSLIRWEDVAAVRWDEESRAVVFEPHDPCSAHDGDEWRRAERYAGIAGPELAERAANIRRKALFGLLG